MPTLTPANPAGRFIKSPKDFWAGIIYVGLAAATIVIAGSYPMGTPFRMGAAYFPTLLGWLLGGIGAVSLVRSFLKAGEPLPDFAWRKLGIVVGAVVVFALIVRGAGLVPALLLLVTISSTASREFRPRTAALLAVAIAAFCYLTFVRGLELPLPAFGGWFGL